MFVRRLVPLFTCVLLAGFAAASAPASRAETAFTRLQSLIGDWGAPRENGRSLRVNYRLISAGSAFVETYNAGTERETMTIFHLDRNDLLATHYCAQGNQPRLKLARSEGIRLVFVFKDASNLPDRKASHLVRLEFVFDDPDRVERIETYAEGGKAEATTLVLTRGAPPAS